MAAVPYFSSGAAFGAATVSAPFVGGYTPYAAPTYGAFGGFGGVAAAPAFAGATVLNSGFAAPAYGAAFSGFGAVAPATPLTAPAFGGFGAAIPAPAGIAPAATVSAAAFPYSAYNGLNYSGLGAFDGLSYSGLGALGGYGYGAAALPAAAPLASSFGYANAFETFSPYSFAPAVSTGAVLPALPAPPIVREEFIAPAPAPTFAAPPPPAPVGNRRVWQDGAERGFGARPQRF